METEVKRHIDNARQVLVGVVPNPISQIDQITYALIYKFMDDMDQSAIAEGGEPSFFIRDLESYSWTKLMDSKIGNQNRMNLYVEAFQKFSEAEQLPELFRNILRQAFLPYRSPDVLWLFLKEIDYFDYSHPEELGNAYEYLLSIMGSQGDAGQFRTPRHIIDFIVDVIQPTENDKILDPACGTGGFLVKAYQHILEQHQGEKKLNPTQKLKIMENFEGYDIDPGMARIAQVNMFLHQFKSPKIVQYDTLSMEERWNDKFDVIMANPPFMSPKGGIKPHSKFSVQSTRSEVLFVDYIMNHLKPKGRAGIIVPEGIIFQSGNAYKQLRKNLVNDGLYAVVSLPSGVFQPYSGVKTSILLFNNEIARQRDEILFIKIENDGFDLGANKRPITKNDLPEALEILSKWNINEKTPSQKALWVTKSRLSESGDYNLSGDRYRINTDYSNAKWPMVELGEVCEIYQPKTITSNEIKETGQYKVFGANGVIGYYHEYNHENPEIAITCRGATCGTVNFTEKHSWITGNAMVVKPKTENLYKKFLFYLLREVDLSSVISGAAQPQITATSLKPFKIPLPPLEIQQQIVEELDSYQNIINGARQIIANWKPRIDIDPSWPKVKLGEEEVFQIIDGDRGLNYPNKEEFAPNGYCLFLNTSNVRKGEFDFLKCDFISKEKDQVLRKGKLNRDDIVLTTRGTLGNSAYYSKRIEFDNVRINSGMVLLRSNLEKIIPEYLLLFLNTPIFDKQLINFMSGSAQPQLPIRVLIDIEIPLPSIEIQKQIVERIESERVLIESCIKLIDIYENKIKSVISKLW